jgi:predicted transposase YdaD
MKNQYSEEEYLKDQKQEAKDTKALEIAKKMLNAGMDIETITAMTGLMPDLIKEKFISFSTAAQDHQKG